MKKLFLILLLVGCASTPPEPFTEADLEQYMKCLFDGLLIPQENQLVTTLINTCLDKAPRSAREFYAQEQARYAKEANSGG